MTVRELKEKVLNKSEIVETIGKFVKLKKKGVDYFGLCPFHDEKSPSFSVSPVKKIYKCFGCGASGDVIGFIEANNKLNFVDALNYLAQEAHIPVSFDNEKAAKNAKNGKELDKVKFVEKAILEATLSKYNINTLFVFLASKLGFDTAFTLMLQFYIGTAKDGSCIYWQVDQFLRVRTANLIYYKPDGHRDKSKYLGRPLDSKKKAMFTGADGYKACFFGEHQLFNSDKDTLIAIVESEKTAVICSVYMPLIDGHKVIYLASSGSNGMTEEKCWVLRGMKICLIPDFSYTARAIWGAVEMRKKDINGKLTIAEDGEVDEEYISIAKRLIGLRCSVFFFDPYPEINDGTDIADELIKMPPPVLLSPIEEDFTLITPFE